MTRKEIITQLEKEQGTKIVTYITGDRQPFPTQIASDVIPLLSNQLEKISSSKIISLFLYTTGGDILTPIRVAKLIRNHCEEFEVLVPYKAHSAGTLIALGADRIVMGKLGELTPVDPSTGHPFNPPNPKNPTQNLAISVEDLNSYFMLAKEKAKVKDEQMIEVYKVLTDKLHPLSLGNTYRAYRMAKKITEKLLYLHMDKKTEKNKIAKIVKEMTGDITIHAYPIDRDEAKELGLKICNPSDSVGQLMKELYDDYAKTMKLGQPFHPTEFLGDNEIAKFEYVSAYMEGSDLSYQFTLNGKVQKSIKNNQSTIDMNLESQSWKEKTT